MLKTRWGAFIASMMVLVMSLAATAPAIAETVEYQLPDLINVQKVSAATPLPVSSVPVSTVSGAASSATTVTNFPANTNGAPEVTFQWTTPGAGNTATYEGSNDGTNWAALSCQAQSTGGMASSVTSAFAVATATPITCSTGGFSQVRARISTYGSGSPAVVAQFSNLQATISAAIWNTISVGGSVAAGATDSGNPVKVGGKFNTSAPTLTDGQRGDLQLDNKGNLHIIIGQVNSNGAVATQPGDSDARAQGDVELVTQSNGMAFNGSTWDRTRTIQGAASSGLGVTAAAVTPTSSVNAAIAPSNGSAVASNLVVKASAGNLYRVSLVAGASAGFLMVFDATSAPADGAVTPKICRPVAASGVLDVDLGNAPYRFATGITAVFSTTGCFNKTASATAYIEAAAL